MNRQENDQDRLQQIAWLLEKSVKPSEEETSYEPPYGDVTALNTCRVILDSVGKETLKEIAEDTIDLLGTSVAVYEANGDYAFGMFSSGWCQLMDAASRALCRTDDNREALDCGKWLCHENCWNDSAKAAIESGRSTDIPCVGGIHLYGEPIYAGDRIVGVINIGYGDPPLDTDRLKALAETFEVNPEDLKSVGAFYASRPQFMVDLAKKRLATSARLIGEMVEKAEAQEILHKSEQDYRELFDSVSDLIYTHDLEGRFLSVNAALKKLFGYEGKEIIGRKPVEFMDPEFRPLFEKEYLEALKRSGHVEGVAKYHGKQGQEIYIEYKSSLVKPDDGNLYISGISRDVSRRIAAQREKKRLESQLQQAQKMEAIATLTGGIAHDYNNLVTIIMGNLGLAIEDTPPGSDQAQFLDEVDKASKKIRDLTHELMALSRGGAPVKKVGPLVELLKSAEALIPQNSRILLSESISADLWQAPHDAYKMGSVFRNVATNAVEAMPDGGALTIKAENLTVADDAEVPDLSLKSGDYVHIAIEDEGSGIPQENLEKLFDPYFSTKARGTQKGMGLGLATAYAIIKKHGGHINIDSTEAVGTTVHIYLPAESQEGKAKKTGDADLTSQSTVINQQSPIQTVLVMDDEKAVRNLAQKMLNRLGYEVETVKEGVKAIELYKKRLDSDEPFDAVILDLTIKGGMGGERTLQELVKIDPDVKAVVSSGYFNDPVMADFQGYGFKGAMAKPYEMKDLKEVLQTVLSVKN
ncbi:MAG: PAS domain S-box protein [Deltaproteobacteria bacterium]|nr:PAS domain S-box protein [Deltaproteobacteria bacterium]